METFGGLSEKRNPLSGKLVEFGYLAEYAFDQNASLTVYCEASSAIEGWDENWNDENCSVVWGCTYQEYLEAIA